jgi:hypothetical protein
LKSRFSIGRFDRRFLLDPQGLDGSNALGHRPGQPEREVARLLLPSWDALYGSIHCLIVADGRPFATA